MATGNSKSAKSARVKLQLRDKKGRWIEMGGGVKWYSPNLGKFMFGTAVDATPEGLAVVEVKNPNPNSNEKIFTVNIDPSQLEKISSKASLDPNKAETIEKPKTEVNPVKPAVDKTNSLFKNIHKNPATHDEPFGPDYEEIPFDPKGTNNLEKNDFVILGTEGTLKKGHVIGFDSKTKDPIIQTEVSASWGFGGKGMAHPIAKITGVYKPKESSPSNQGSDKKADILVPSSTKPIPGVPTITTDAEGLQHHNDNYLIGNKGKKSAMDTKTAIAKKDALEKEAADKDSQEKKEKKLAALMAASVGTRLLSSDETTINLVKQDAGYWKEEGTGDNYTSTQVAEKFAGEKGVSMISPPAKPVTLGEASSDMTSEEFKSVLSDDEKFALADKLTTSAYTVPNPAYMSPGYNTAEEEALAEYVGDSSFINQALRANNSDVKSNQAYIAGLDQIIEKSPLIESTTVWRGIRANPAIFEALENDGTYIDKGYSSTSSYEEVARNWIKGTTPGSTNKAVTLEIKLPVGFKAHKVDYSMGHTNGFEISHYDEEEEVILPRNTAYKVISMKQNENNSGYTAVVEPVLTAHNSIEGTKNDGNTTGSTGDSGSTGETESKDQSGTIPSGVGGPDDSNGGTDSGTSGETEQGPESGSEPGNDVGPLVSEETPIQELGKLYSDAQGQYMAGTNGQKFRKGDTVSYTKKGVTETGNIVALYEGVKSARVEWPDGSNSVKKINALTVESKAPEADTVPVQEESAPVAEPKVGPDAAEAINTLNSFHTSPDFYDEGVPFDSDFPVAIKNLPIGTTLKLAGDNWFALKKTPDGSWAHAKHPNQEISEESIEMAMGLKNKGKPSYNIYMPKDAIATAPVSEVVDTPEAQEVPAADVPVVPEFNETSGNFDVVSNENSSPGTFHVKTKDNTPVSVDISTLKEGDVLYAVGTQSKPYGTHGNYSASQAFVNALHPAGLGTVTKNDPNKPYIQVKGADGEMYFPSKNFVATKQTPEIDELIAKAAKQPAFKDAEVDTVEELAAPEEIVEMETAAAKTPVDVSAWKKLKSSSGSNPGGEYEAPDGTHYFIKQSKSDLHAKNEVLASDIYQAAGVNSLELGYSDVNGSGKLGTIAPMLSDAKDNFQSALKNEAYRKEFQKGWAVDAWLGNWDVVGLSYDNALTDGQGKAIRVDPGGALLFRAMGTPKTEAMFSDSVGEWDSMRTDPNNYQTNEAFGDMTNEQIKESVGLVASFTDEKIDELINKHEFDQETSAKLKKRLKNRRDDLIERANALPGEKINPPLAQWEIDILNGNTTEDELFDSMDDTESEITNEMVSPQATFKEDGGINQEALAALKKKLLEMVPAPVDETEEEPLANWEKELLEGVQDEAKAEADNAFEETIDIGNKAVGTLYHLPNSQNAFVGKYHTEISFGKTVDYFKKGEKKTGVVTKIMVNQQSADVIWPDGSHSIVKATQLIGKGEVKKEAAPAITEPDIELVVPPVTVPETKPATGWVKESWTDDIDAAAVDYPIGTVMSWDSEPEPNGYGWEKTGQNKWVSVGTKDLPTPITYPDSEMDEVKGNNHGYAMFLPAYNGTMPATEEVKEPSVDSLAADESGPLTIMNWLEQGGKPEHMPIGTIFSTTTGSKYEKITGHGWQPVSGNSTMTYPDSDMYILSKENVTVELPEGFEFFNPDSKAAAAYPIGTTINKAVVLEKISDYGWNTSSGLTYSNNEVDNMSMPSSFIVKPVSEDVSSESTAPDLFENIEQVVGNISKTWESYVESVGEENSSWDHFTDEFDEYIPDGENLFVTIGDTKYKVVPDYSSGSLKEARIETEFGELVTSIPVAAHYSDYDSYYFNTQLDTFFAQLQVKADEKNKVNEPVSSEETSPVDMSWDSNAPYAAKDLPIGTAISTANTTLKKEDTNHWKSIHSSSTYDDSTIDNIKNAGWNINIPVNSKPVEEPESTDYGFIEKAWLGNTPSASDLPLGSQISTGTGTSKITFEKKAGNVWSPTNGMTSIKHSDDTMNQLKTGPWMVSAPASAFVPKPVEVVPEEVPAQALADQFMNFHNKFSTYMNQLADMSWPQAKGTELEFEVDGKSFTLMPHPMSSSFAPYMYIIDENGKKVFSENDFEISDGEPFKFEASDVFNAAKSHVETFAPKKPAATAIPVEYTLPAGTSLADVSYGDFAAVPAGTKIQYMVNGKVYGAFLKNSNNTWRFQDIKKEKPSHKTENNDDFKYLMDNNKDAAANYVLVGPEAPKVTEEEIVVIEDKPKNVFTHTTIESKEQLNDYPVGTVVKYEQTSYTNNTKGVYFVKETDSLWTKYQKNPSTVVAKGTTSVDGVFSTFNSWYKAPAAVSIPASGDVVMLGNGEHAAIGDLVFQGGNSQPYTLEKINKTALNLVDINGNKVKIPAKKLFKDLSFGVKSISTQPATSKYDVDTVDPLSAYVESLKAEKAIQDKLINFAGASGTDYDEKGLGLPISDQALAPKNIGLSVISVEPGNTESPLFGVPKPTMPSSPEDYTSFEESVLDGLPKWNSSEWLKKVEERYLANPNKKFENVQKSTQWGKIQEVLKGNEGYKSYLNQLLSNKYVDQDLFDMAETAINEQEKINKPLKKAHQENVAKEKAEYEAKKVEYMAKYENEVAKYTAEVEEWSKVNINAGSVKQLPKLPELTNNPFTGGPANWSQSHPGTHSVQSIMDAMRNDNHLGRFGLAAAVGADKIEETSVVFNKIKDMSGVEKFEIKFKVTSAYGAHLANKFKADPSINKSTGIYYPAKTNMAGKPDNALAKLTGKPSDNGFVNGGHRFEFTDEVSGGTVVFQHANQTGQNVSVNHNSVQILLDINAKPEDFQLVLENLGIGAKPATAGALRVVAENKLLTMFSGKSNWGDENFGGSTRTSELEKIKKEFGITVDDVVVETDANGRIKFFLTDAKVEEFMKVSPVKEFKHSVYAGEDLNVWESILTGTNPGLAANYFRGQNGIGELKSGTGMSPEKDMAVGSGAGIFITPHSSKETSAPYYNFIGIDRKAIMRRLDYWGNMSDNYGKNDKGSPTPFKLMKNHGSFHEVMPRDGVPLSDFAWVAIGSEQSKKKLIERLTAKGIFMINGVPLEKFILTNHEQITPIPTVNVMGAGIAPSGAAGPVA